MDLVVEDGVPGVNLVVHGLDGLGGDLEGANAVDRGVLEDFSDVDSVVDVTARVGAEEAVDHDADVGRTHGGDRDISRDKAAAYSLSVREDTGSLTVVAGGATDVDDAEELDGGLAFL